jgi:hypothetical protein
MYKAIFHEAIDLIITGIQSCFDQPGYKMFADLENLLIEGSKGEPYDVEFNAIIEIYRSNFSAAS